MHFVGSTHPRLFTYISVIALSIGVPFWFSIPVTIASAAVAISASFIALGSSILAGVLKGQRYRNWRSFSLVPEDDLSPWDDGGSGDPFNRSSHSQTGESYSSSARAELEALLSDQEEFSEIPVDSWAGKYLVTRLLWRFWHSCTVEGVIKGFFLGLVFVTMHYSGSMMFRGNGLF
jgi:hypothetical protein